MKGVSPDGTQLLICNVDGSFYAVHDECTHECFPLSAGELEGRVITCMLHGAQFDVGSGEVLALPAYESLRTYEVRIEGEDVFVALD